MDQRGFVNAHTHLYSGLVPLGMPEPSPPPQGFLEILNRIWWRLDRALDHASLRAAARYYVAEALLAGTATIVDHHESPSCIDGSLDVIADACDELGVRALLCYGATERNGGRDEAAEGLEECRRFLRENRRPLVRGAVGLHASFTVSDETIREAGDLGREFAAPLHVHVAEDEADVYDCRQRGYDHPFERLHALRAILPGSILAHGVHLEEEAVRVATREGCWFVQNPRSNRGNRVGYPSALCASERVALGTDGYPADMPEEARQLETEAGRHGDSLERSRARLGAGHALAAELLPDTGLDDDAVVFDGEDVRDVTIAGRAVVASGQLLTADLEEIRVQAEEQARLLWARMQSLPES